MGTILLLLDVEMSEEHTKKLVRLVEDMERTLRDINHLCQVKTVLGVYVDLLLSKAHALIDEIEGSDELGHVRWIRGKSPNRHEYQLICGCGRLTNQMFTLEESQRPSPGEVPFQVVTMRSADHLTTLTDGVLIVNLVGRCFRCGCVYVSKYVEVNGKP